MIDGETITVCSVDGAEVHGYTASGERVRFLLTRVGGEPAAVNEQWRFGAVLLKAGALSDAQLREAASLLGDFERGVVRLSLRGSGARVAGGAEGGVRSCPDDAAPAR
ncbi:MAG: hypothetical protein ABSH51_05245 [Solirubrobacteraceae bacterium]